MIWYNFIENGELGPLLVHSAGKCSNIENENVAKSNGSFTGGPKSRDNIGKVKGIPLELIFLEPEGTCKLSHTFLYENVAAPTPLQFLLNFCKYCICSFRLSFVFYST